MPLIAFITGVVTLISTGVGAYSAASLCYGAFHWFQGDHQRARSGIVGALLGAGIVLTSVGTGTLIAGIAHG